MATIYSSLFLKFFNHKTAQYDLCGFVYFNLRYYLFLLFCSLTALKATIAARLIKMMLIHNDKEFMSAVFGAASFASSIKLCAGSL